MKKILAMLMVILCVASLAACDMSGAVVYDIGNVDRANYFQKIYNEYVDMYGEADLTKNTALGDVLTGVAVVRLLDFTGDGAPELYLAYADGTTDYVNKQLVVGFDYGAATLIGKDTTFSDTITSKASTTDEAPSIWLYKDTYGRSYLVTGGDMNKSADYNTYIQMRDNEKVYAFELDFTQKDGAALDGTYEKINLVNLTKEDAEIVFEENEKAVNSIKGQADKK